MQYELTPPLGGWGANIKMHYKISPPSGGMGAKTTEKKIKLLPPNKFLPKPQPVISHFNESKFYHPEVSIHQRCRRKFFKICPFSF